MGFGSYPGSHPIDMARENRDKQHGTAAVLDPL